MCLAIPVQIIEIIDTELARVSADGIVREINISLLDTVQVGDYVILHVGYALSKLDQDEAQQTLKDMEEAGLLSSDGERQS